MCIKAGKHCTIYIKQNYITKHVVRAGKNLLYYKFLKNLQIITTALNETTTFVNYYQLSNFLVQDFLH